MPNGFRHPAAAEQNPVSFAQLQKADDWAYPASPLEFNHADERLENRMTRRAHAKSLTLRTRTLTQCVRLVCPEPPVQHELVLRTASTHDPAAVMAVVLARPQPKALSAEHTLAGFSVRNPSGIGTCFGVLLYAHRRL